MFKEITFTCVSLIGVCHVYVTQFKNR